MMYASPFSFGRRGLPALLLIAAGLALAIVFRKSSGWPVDSQRLAYPVALVLAVGGSVLFSSYVRQRPLSVMKIEMLSAVFLVATLLLTRLY